MTESTTRWRDDAACLTVDPEVFFPDRSDVDGNLRAKAICDRCDVVDQCLEYALRSKQDYGIWGGVSETGRKRIGGPRGCRDCLTEVPPGYQYCDVCGPQRRGRGKQARNALRARAAA